MSRLMLCGFSWSGRERKCVFLNLRDGSFADVSALSGIDYVEDGRAVATTDWDGDGDLDLWMKFRSGPQIRFLRNDQPPASRWVAFQLVGKSCNRDAIGGKVLLEIGGQRAIRAVAAGDGYLSQSSKWLQFGLPETGDIQRVTVKWPGGPSSEFTGLEANARYRITQGSDRPERLPDRRSRLEDRPIEPAEPPASARLVLKVPFSLPPGLLAETGASRDSNRASLIALWASWCAPCLSELQELAREKTRLAEVGLRVCPLNVDKPEDRTKAAAVFERAIKTGKDSADWQSLEAAPGTIEALDAVLKHVRDREGLASLPLSLLVDSAGKLQVIYIGKVGLDDLVSDASTYGGDRVPPHKRSVFPGRWYFDVPRNLADLARDLRSRARPDDAAFMERLNAQRPDAR
ncbi:MAG TPA: ASPIC/UnbV domain-containing protein [Phycisphaerae bacterium]|nr:ASPIC/UnbV domain-containing protein [Phycisphaerae bacterium]